MKKEAKAVRVGYGKYRCLGKVYRLREMAELGGVSTSMILWRMSVGKDPISTKPGRHYKKKYKLRGKMFTTTELAQVLGVKRGTIINRIHRKTDPTAMKTSVAVFDWRGDKFTLRQLAEVAGKHRNTVTRRIKKGLDPVYGYPLKDTHETK